MGYLENDDMRFNIARLSRDVQVCSIWEGTTDMMSHDVIRVMFGKTRKEVVMAMDHWIESMKGSAASVVRHEADWVGKSWGEYKSTMRSKVREEIELRSRSLMEKLGDIVMGALLVMDASSDLDEVAIEATRSWFGERCEDTNIINEEHGWQQAIERDKRLVFGRSGPEERARL